MFVEKTLENVKNLLKKTAHNKCMLRKKLIDIISQSPKLSGMNLNYTERHPGIEARIKKLREYSNPNHTKTLCQKV